MLVRRADICKASDEGNDSPRQEDKPPKHHSRSSAVNVVNHYLLRAIHTMRECCDCHSDGRDQCNSRDISWSNGRKDESEQEEDERKQRRMPACAPYGELGPSIQRCVLLRRPKHQGNANEREQELFRKIGGYLTHTQACKFARSSPLQWPS